jgi:CDP-diglyceride synthetase
LLLALTTGIFSVIGDLYESIYKRAAGAKDSGNILPGHGGMFDRLDCCIFCQLVLALRAKILNLSGCKFIIDSVLSPIDPVAPKRVIFFIL